MQWRLSASFSPASTVFLFVWLRAEHEHEIAQNPSDEMFRTYDEAVEALRNVPTAAGRKRECLALVDGWPRG
jgi:hypothetical protein